MDFEKICKERYSVRKFSQKKVEDEKITKILEMVRLAPTARNNQPYEVFVAKTDDALEKIKQGKDNIFGAPVIIVVCSDENKNWEHPVNGKNSTLQDIGIICATFVYACTEVGLGSLYACAFDPEVTKKALDLPDNLTPETLILVGYPEEDCVPSPMHFSRREIDEFVKEIK